LNYTAPWWLPGGNLQTIWPALYARRVFGPHPQYRRERWTTPDGDFIDVDFLHPAVPPDASPRPLLVLFHGLEGSSRSHYAEAFADFAREQGWDYAVPHFRGCSGELNHGPRAYHSGDWEEIDWVLRRLRQGHAGPLLVVGISLGGNALMRWAGELGEGAAPVVQGVASVCSPIDLAAGATTLLPPGAACPAAQRPGLFALRPGPPRWGTGTAASSQTHAGNGRRMAAPKPAFSTTTASAMVGASAGAKAMYSAWSRWCSSSLEALYLSFCPMVTACAVPVLPPER
jgi:pimeloyl-ACP methyl ester carboxylesterase